MSKKTSKKVSSKASKSVSKKASKKVSPKESKHAGARTENVRLFKALRAEGINKRKAARIAKRISPTQKGSTSTAPATPVSATPLSDVPVAPLPDLPAPPPDTPVAESAPTAAFENLTKADLLEQARARDLPGRSTMSKGELLEALRASEHVSA